MHTCWHIWLFFKGGCYLQLASHHSRGGFTIPSFHHTIIISTNIQIRMMSYHPTKVKNYGLDGIAVMYSKNGALCKWFCDNLISKLGIWKINICDRACENRTCGHMNFAYFFNLSELITFYLNSLWQWPFQRLVQIYLALWCRSQNENILFQYWDITFRETGCSLCLHALFSQARSHMFSDFIAWKSGKRRDDTHSSAPQLAHPTGESYSCGIKW